MFNLLKFLFLINLVFSQIDYDTEIQSIFNSKCTSCHGNSAGLNLSSHNDLMDGSNNGDVIVPFDHTNSELWIRVESGQMPPSGSNLTTSEVNLIADWIDEGALNEPATCTDPEAYNCSDSINGDYVTDIGGIIYDNSCSSCSSGEACDGYYGSSTECYYYQAPSASEVSFTTSAGSISLDWSSFSPPALSSLVDYRVSRCVEEGCVALDNTENTSITDLFDYDESDDIKYIISVNYENNPYWGWANSEPVYPFGGSTCTDPEAYNCSDSINGDYVTDIGGIIYDNSCSSCSSGEACDGYYGSSTECYYYQAPSASEVSFTTSAGSISLDWSSFSPPALSSLVDYRVSRCVEEGCVALDNTENTSITDLFDYDESDDIKYIISVNYENNPYWGWANSEPVYPFSDCVDLGDLNGDGGWNVLDIVGLANCVLASNCNELDNGCAGDMNGDGGWNVLDIVGLANCVLASNCSDF